MKQLMIFDIKNDQSDYSRVTECILLLKDSKFNDVGNLVKKEMQGKFHRVTLFSEVGAPRYFECPQGKFVQKSDGLHVLQEEKLMSEEYYKILKKHDISDIAHDRLSELYYLNDENKCCKAEIPYSLRSYMSSTNTTSKVHLQEAVDNNEVYYHIRVQINLKTLYDLQYLGILLKKFSALVSGKRISVLLLSDNLSLKCYPFCNPKDEIEIEKVNELHKIFSRYLRLLAQDNTGVIFAPYYDKKNNGYVSNVTPMNYRDSSIGSNFFPLVDIGEKEYERFFGDSTSAISDRNNELSSEIKRENLYKQNSSKTDKYVLFQTGTKRFFNADARDPRAALLAFVAETAWKRLKTNWLSEKELDDERFADSREKIIDVFTREKNNWITFSIFSFIFSGVQNDNSTAHINEAYQIARELSTGLQQLIQNAIQHSEKHSCFFTFFLDEQERKLKLFVTDSNEQDTMIENFTKRLKDEVFVCERMQNEQCADTNAINYKHLAQRHTALIKSESIALRHFFNVFENEEDMKSLWKAFRQSDSTAHVGLLTFYQTLIHCHADLRLQSSKRYFADQKGQDVFIDKCDEQNNRKRNTTSIQCERILPGTQYLISLPIENSYKTNPIGEASLSDITSFSEDYATFARYVDFEAKYLHLGDKFNYFLSEVRNYTITEPKEKFAIQLLWTKFWYNYFSVLNAENEGKKVFTVRITDAAHNYLSNTDNIEVFLKGMFGALSSEFIAEKPIYFALTNLNSIFLDCLRSLCIALSNKKFPNNIQLYFIDSRYDKHALLFGNSFYDAVNNASHLAIEHGSNLFRYDDAINAAHITLDNSSLQGTGVVPVMPFDTIITIANDTAETIFDAHMLAVIAERMDLKGCQGYKLENTHMRLGSKVHIQSFYEMSFLFYRTTIANRTAFKILRSYAKLLRKKIDEKSFSVSPILFYSYASYSKAILTSLVEITREYIKRYISSLYNMQEDHDGMSLEEIYELAISQIAFASYQYNLQSETNNDSVQLYFGIPEKYSGAIVNKKGDKGERFLILKNNIDVILVVPISSTLTTFGKMFSKLNERVSSAENSAYKLNLSANYTSLWVCDAANFEKRTKNDVLYPTNIEKKYWYRSDLRTRIVEIKAQNRAEALYALRDCPQIHFFLQVKATWENPLFCSLCFPNDNELIQEVPLVETDLTSTVPSQQIREEMLENRKNFSDFSKMELVTKNNERIKLLKDCVFYGHIKRGKNHYQYYINSQDFFYKNEVQSDICEWLKCLKKEQRYNAKAPKLKIIFSPEHNTNVGFAQYVNTYYFDGTAEVVSINEDKVFRSNFVCEHEMLRQTIERLHIQQNIFENWEPVEFYFVDDNINTGATINKANSLLRSLIPDEYALKYPSFLFKECFILIDRISNASKRPFVASGRESDFHSYVHIDISNMRVHGDSCVGCKLQKETEKLLKRSASRITANYWANKYLHLQTIDYDNLNDMENFKNDMYAYERLVLSHIVQNYVFKDNITLRKKGEYYDNILFLFYAIFEYSDNKKYDKVLLNGNFKFKTLLASILDNTDSDNNVSKTSITHMKIHIAELLLKLLARPFFSFDYSFRVQMQSFLLIFSECYLDNYSNINQKITDWKEKAEELYAMIPENDAYKGFLREKNRIEKTVDIIQCFIKYHADSPSHLSKFFTNVLFEALADMRSTYLLRKRVIIRVNDFVNNYLSISNLCGECNHGKKKCKKLLDETQCVDKTAAKCFWISYFAHIQRIIDCSSDEIKAIWFEYLVLSGKEIKERHAEGELKHYLGIEKHLQFSICPVAAELFLITASTEFDATEKIISANNARYLSNYYQTRKWKKQTTNVTSSSNSWHSFLSSGYKDSSQKDTDKRYGDFLDKLLDYVSNLNAVDKNIFNIALLTMSTDSETASISRIQLLKDRFGKHVTVNQDLKQARYIIKDRVSTAFNCEKVAENSVGILTDNGYTISFADNIPKGVYERQQEELCFEDHHVSGNHRKPYIIFLFDNPNKDISNEELSRDLTPLNYVFLYISMNVAQVTKRRNLPWLILRDILAYRNQMLKFFAEDFNGNLMEKHAVSMQEEAILSHERSASHASTADEKGVLRVFGLENVSELDILQYPIDLKSKNILDGTKNPVNYNHSADLWLLLQNYVNSQIARLFSRQFNDNLIENDDVPALYLSSCDEQTDNIFKRCLRTFGDLHIMVEDSNQDNRFKLLTQAANIYCYIKGSEPLYCYKNQAGNKYYNTEYIFCILLDIIFSSLKYATVDDALLPRVDSLILYKNWNKEKWDTSQNKHITPFASAVASYIFMFKEGKDLVIINNVKAHRIDEEKISLINEEIYRRIHDPLDYGDGHMSLFTISKFILGIRTPEGRMETSFKYIDKDTVKKQYGNLDFYCQHSNIIDAYDIWFETRLPIFMEGNDDEQ